MKKAIVRVVARHQSEDRPDAVLLWSAGLWVAALIYLLATFDSLR